MSVRMTQTSAASAPGSLWESSVISSLVKLAGTINRSMQISSDWREMLQESKPTKFHQENLLVFLVWFCTFISCLQKWHFNLSHLTSHFAVLSSRCIFFISHLLESDLPVHQPKSGPLLPSGLWFYGGRTNMWWGDRLSESECVFWPLPFLPWAKQQGKPHRLQSGHADLPEWGEAAQSIKLQWQQAFCMLYSHLSK